MTFNVRTRTAPAQRALSLVLSCVFAAFAACPALAQAAKPTPDTIIFTNGDQLTGTFLHVIGDTVTFKSDIAGEVSFPLSKVKELHSGGSFAVLRKDRPVTKQPVTPGTITLSGDNITVATTNAPEYNIPTKDVGFIIDKDTYVKETNPHPPFSYGWNGAITGGATIIEATQTGQSYNAGISLIRAIPTVPYLPKRNRTIFNLIETYGKLTQPAIPATDTPYSQVKTSIFHTDVEQDEYFTPRLYVLGTAVFDHNFSLGLQFQQIYGVGIGWTVIQDAKQEFDIRGDIHYERQTFIQPTPQIPPIVGTPDKDLIGATISEDYIRHLPGKLVLTEAASFLPAFNDTQAYSANGMVGLAMPVYHRFSVHFTTSDTYLNEPAVGFEKNSYQFITGVTYTLH